MMKLSLCASGADSAAAGVPTAAAASGIDYTEVPLDSLDISAADSFSLSPNAGVCLSGVNVCSAVMSSRLVLSQI